jgi:outer membrane protein
MTKLLCRVVPGLLLLSLLTGPAFAQQKIGTVDMKRIFEHYWKKKAAEDQLQQVKDDMDKEERNMRDEFKQVKTEYDAAVEAAKDQNISPEERDKRAKTVDDKLKQMKDLDQSFTEYHRNAQSRLVEQTQRMRNKIIDEIRTVTDGKAKAAGYSLVIDTAAQSGDATPIVLYTDNANDLTDAVLLELNRSAPVATTTDAKPSGGTNNNRPVGSK